MRRFLLAMALGAMIITAGCRHSETSPNGGTTINPFDPPAVEYVDP